MDELHGIAINYKQANLDVLNHEAQFMADLLNAKKTQGDEIFGEVRDYSNHVDDAIRQTAGVLNELNNDEIPKLERENVDLESDLHRLEELNVKYAPTTRQLLQGWRDFEIA